MAEPEFTRFVSPVVGRTVSRWDATGSYFGARVATAEERKAGAEPVKWDAECVVPLTAQFCARFDRELRNALRNGDLVERKHEDWRAWLELEEKRETERAAQLNAAEPAASKSTPPAEADKPEGRKKSR